MGSAMSSLFGPVMSTLIDPLMSTLMGTLEGSVCDEHPDLSSNGHPGGICL